MIVSETAARVYAALATYAFDEAEAWPSQARLARDTGLCRQTVNRAIAQLTAAGWIEVSKRRGRRWDFNVYALLAPFAVASGAARRITRAAHRRARAVARRVRASRPRHEGDHHEEQGQEDAAFCGCGSCRSARVRVAPPPRRTWQDRTEDQLRLRLGADAYRDILIAGAGR